MQTNRRKTLADGVRPTMTIGIDCTGDRTYDGTSANDGSIEHTSVERGMTVSGVIERSNE